MLLRILQYYYKIKPVLNGRIFKLFFQGKNLKIGSNFQCDTWPKLLVNGGSKVIIGDNVTLRRNVEIRSHSSSIIKIGNNCRIDRGVRLLATNHSKLILEENVRVGLYSVFNGGDTIEVQKNCLISGFVYLQTSMHNYSGNESIQSQGFSHSPIYLGEDCWLGTHAVIFPGTRLGSRCVVGSSSVVNKSFAKSSVIAGIPAKLIKLRNEI